MGRLRLIRYWLRDIQIQHASLKQSYGVICRVLSTGGGGGGGGGVGEKLLPQTQYLPPQNIN